MKGCSSEKNPFARRLNAQRLVPEAPDHLDALLLYERPEDGLTLRLVAVGDIGLSGRIRPVVLAGHDPFREVAAVLQSADLAFGNLETPLVDGPEKGLFAAPSKAASLLAAAGFNVVSLANNHILDHGVGCFNTTRQLLAEAGVRCLGVGDVEADARRLITLDFPGPRVGLLGCARTRQPKNEPGFWEYDPAALEAEIRRARRNVDVLIVSIHMGYMYVDYPDPDQRGQVQALLEAGADLVLLHHAHVVQGVEVTAGDGIACYNLGNFLFDWEEGTARVDQSVWQQRSGALFVFDLDRRGVARAGALPIHVDDQWTIRWARGEDGERVLQRLQDISDWDRDISELFQRQRAERNTALVFSSVFQALRRGQWRAVLGLLPRLRPKHLKMVGGWALGRLVGDSGKKE